MEFEDYTVSENVGNLTVVITRGGDSAIPIVLQLEAKGITAEPGLDFDFKSILGEIRLLPGQIRKE